MSEVAEWSVLLHRNAEKVLKKIARSDKDLFRRLDETIWRLQYEPLPSGVKRLRGHPLYSLRVGDWRIIYAVEREQRVVVVLHIGHRREVYRDL